MRRGHSTSHAPGCQGSLSTRRVTVDPVDGLSGQTSLPGNLSHPPPSVARAWRAPCRVCRLTAEVSLLVGLLHVFNSGPLRRLAGLGLCPGSRGHEAISASRTADCTGRARSTPTAPCLALASSRARRGPHRTQGGPSVPNRPRPTLSTPSSPRDSYGSHWCVFPYRCYLKSGPFPKPLSGP
jgi:hypothetical protein